MAFFTKSEFLIFLVFLALGVVVSALKSIIKKVISNKNNLIRQLFYSLLALLACFSFYLLTVLLNMGIMRFFMVVATICGYLLYSKIGLFLTKLFKIKIKSRKNKVLSK